MQNVIHFAMKKLIVINYLLFETSLTARRASTNKEAAFCYKVQSTIIADRVSLAKFIAV